MTVDKVLISSRFGDELTVEEYEEAQKGDLIQQEIRRLYPQISGEFARTLTRGYKSKWHDPITRAVSGRYYSSEEIRKENEEMAKRTQTIKRTILLNMMENAGQWMSPKQLAKGTGLDFSHAGQRGALSSVLSTMYPFLEQCGVAQRRQDPGGRGYVYCYDPKAVDTASEIVDKVFYDFLAYERKRMSEKRAKAKGRDPVPPIAPKEKGTQIPGTLEQTLPLIANGESIRVNVEFNVNIRFGLLKD